MERLLQLFCCRFPVSPRPPPIFLLQLLKLHIELREYTLEGSYFDKPVVAVVIHNDHPEHSEHRSRHIIIRSHVRHPVKLVKHANHRDVEYEIDKGNLQTVSQGVGDDHHERSDRAEHSDVFKEFEP